MRRLSALLLLLAAFACWNNAQGGELRFDEAQKIALIVARHEHITVDDRTTVLNSMDTRGPRGFIPGYYTFSIIRESDSPGQPDDTIRVYVVSKRTADTWELNLCTHYSFPELERMQQVIRRETGATPEEEHGMPKAIGCSNAVQAQSNSLR